MESLLCDSRRGRKPPLQTIRKDVKRRVIHWGIVMLYKQILQNKRKTLFLVALFSVHDHLLGCEIGYLVNNVSINVIIILLMFLVVYITISSLSASYHVTHL